MRKGTGRLECLIQGKSLEVRSVGRLVEEVGVLREPRDTDPSERKWWLPAVFIMYNFLKKEIILIKPCHARSAYVVHLCHHHPV